MSCKRYIIDFDYTLLDTHHFKQDLAAVFSLKGDELTLAWQSVGGAGHYNPWEHARLQGHGDRYDAAIDAVCAQTSRYLFPNVAAWLKQLDGIAQLLTRGDLKFQQAKVKNSGLEPFFQSILVTEGDKVAALSATPQDQWVLVNDSAPELQALIQAYPQAEVICLRGPYSREKNLPWPVHDPREFFSGY